MENPPYAEWQQLYNEIVTEHTDDLKGTDVVMSSEIVNNALAYFREAVFPLVYPAKSYAVAIIYAAVLSDVYSLRVEDVLDDPDLFLGQDPHFVRFSDDPETYFAIARGLSDIPNWLESGWAPKTVEYCLKECTEAGVDSIM